MRTRNHRSRTAAILMRLALLLLPPAAGADVFFVDPGMERQFGLTSDSLALDIEHFLPMRRTTS